MTLRKTTLGLSALLSLSKGGTVVGGWDLAVSDEGEELAAPSLGLAHELGASRGGHRHGEHAVEPSLGRGMILRERGVLEVGPPTPDRNGPAEEATECWSEGSLAGIDRVLHVAQHMHDPNAIDRLHFTAAVAFRWAALVKPRRRRDRPSA